MFVVRISLKDINFDFSVNIKLGIIHLVRLQIFQKHQQFLPPETHRYVSVSGVKNCSFFRKFHKRTK